VENEAKIRRYTKTVLQKCGYTVITAASASDALGLGKTAEADLLVCTGALSQMGGVELAQKVQQMQPDLKVLIISEAAEHESEHGYAVLKKPFTSEALLRKIRKILV
jgi:CheY-like chemotaxis protein